MRALFSSALIWLFCPCVLVALLGGLLVSLLGNFAEARHSKHLHSSRKTISSSDLLIKLAPHTLESASFIADLGLRTAQVQKLDAQWIRVRSKQALDLNALVLRPEIEEIQPNYKIKLLENYQIEDPLRRAALARWSRRSREMTPPPALEKTSPPDVTQQKKEAFVVAVLDTGVTPGASPTWHNSREIPENQRDDDQNGYVDDISGWDFVAETPRPNDLSLSATDVLLYGGNPGHGTLVAHLIARLAPDIKILPLRLLSEKGEGQTADAIRAIHYAVDNGAKIITGLWMAEGEDLSDGNENKALRESLQYAADQGVLFVAAAGGSQRGLGSNNDQDPHPFYPAGYPHENIISVTALDETDNLAPFANWGAQSVDLAASGFSQEVMLDILGFKLNWEGTSIAAAQVAGATALYWSDHPRLRSTEIKAHLLSSTQKLNVLAGKSVSGGKLDVKSLLSF